LYLRMDGEVITEASFVGSGCCISKAAASLLTEVVKGKTKPEVKALFDRMHGMVTTGEVAEGVGKLEVFAGVHKFPARVKCAILPWHAVMAALEGKGEPVTTEKEDDSRRVRCLSGRHHSLSTDRPGRHVRYLHRLLSTPAPPLKRLP